jgi:hypothetical protein
VIGTWRADPTYAARAARLYGAADAVRTSIGAPIPPVDRERYESDVELIRSSMDAASFDAAWAEGRSMELEQAVVEAQQTPVFPATGIQ